MILRARLDLSSADFAHGALACVLPASREDLEGAIRGAFTPPQDAFVCLSVRSGFDLLLGALALSPGDEVLFSAVTIPDLPRIARVHGLVPVPVDVDPDTLEPDPRALQRCLSPRSRVLVVAHLFGAVAKLDAVRAVAREHGLLFIEDCAQCHAPGRTAGSPDSDVRMLSFGPIKTDTALGGGVLLVRDTALRARMEERQNRLPLQARGTYAKRVLKYAVLQLLGREPLFALLRAYARLRGTSHDAIIGRATRSFAGGELLERIRRRPSTPQLALLARRVTRPNLARLRARATLGDEFARALPHAIRRPGAGVADHTHWLFPVLVSRPDELKTFLWARGFDATRGTSSLAAMEAAPERPDVGAPHASDIMEQLLFVPVYPEIPAAALKRLALALSDHAASSASPMSAPATSHAP
jgi:dTDP-4-amino-4,6-dideoxygalactose transaminase